MSLDTLLEAAKFVELQERLGLRAGARETPPSREEFPSSFCTPEPLPLLNGRLAAAAAPPAPVAVPTAPAILSPGRPYPPAPPPTIPPSVRSPPSANPPPVAPLALVSYAHHPAVRPAPVGAVAPQAPQAPQVPQASPPPPHQFSPQPGAPAPPAPTPVTGQTSDSPTPTGQDDDLLGQESRRRTGSGTREVHNKLEKNRRAHLKECFEMLKRQLPTCQEEKKCSNLSILHAAIRFIQSLRRKERDYEHEMERLAREKISAQQRLAVLKKDLAAQWDHIDINALYPDLDAANGEMSARVRLPSPASTSTASAEMEGGMIIDEDEDDDDDDDTMSFHSGRQRSASDSSNAVGVAPSAPVPVPAPTPAHCSPGPGPPHQPPHSAPPSLRDVHGYRGESPPAPLQTRTRSPVSPRPRTASPVIPMRVTAPSTPNGHIVDASMYKDGRGASAPSCGYVPAKLLNYSIKVASPASSLAKPSASSPPGPSATNAVGAVGVVTRVPSSPVGTLTSRSRASSPHRASPPTPAGTPNAPSPTALLQPVALPALPLAHHHIQLPAQVVNNGRWLGVSPAILQLAAPAVPGAALTAHAVTSNGATPLISHQRLRELGGAAGAAGAAPAALSPPRGPLGTMSTATAAISMPAVGVHANKVMVGATGIAPGVAPGVAPSLTIVGDGFHKSSSAEGIRPASDMGVLCANKGLPIAPDTNGHLLTAAVHPGSAAIPAHVTHVVSTHPSLSPLVTPVTVMSQGSPVTHILATSSIGKMGPLIKTMPIVNPQYLSAVVKPTMVVVSSASAHPPNSGV